MAATTAQPTAGATALADAGGPATRVTASTSGDLASATPRRRPVVAPAAVLYPDPAVADHAGEPALCFADYDACFHDGNPVASAQAWLAIIAANRLTDVRGAFALAWIDTAGHLHLARDGIGERTLYYAATPQGAVYGVSIRAMLATGRIPRTLNRAAIAAYLSYAYLPGSETLVANLYEVLPGEHVTISPRGDITRRQFWTLHPSSRPTGSEPALTAELRSCLEAAVRRRLPQAGENVAAFLSGGLDSSLVVALARQLHDGPLDTYSVFFGDGYANELAFSSLVAAHCGTNHTILELTPPAVLRYLDETIALLSDPIGDPLTVPNALLFRQASARSGIVLNGEGSDPCFGGPKNLPMVLAQLYSHLEAKPSQAASFLRAHLKCYDDLPEMLTPHPRDALAAAPLETAIAPLLDDPVWPDFVARLQALNINLKGAHHILPKVNALSAPFGILPRSPLFDRDIVELAMRIPSHLKLQGSSEKFILKQAVHDLLPAAIIERPKSGMLVPVEAWFQGPLLPAARERLLDGLAPYDLIERPYLEKLLAGQLGGLRPRHGAKIWLLVTLEAWLRAHLPALA